MKKLFFAAAIATVAFLGACSSSDSGDPKAVLSEFFDALARGNMEKAKTLATADSKSMLDMMEMGMKNSKNELAKYDKSKMEFGVAKIDGDKATVPVKELTSGEMVNYPMKKVDGKWKVAFDKSSLMQMGMEKMNEKGINPADSIGAAMDQMNKMNMDSMAPQMSDDMDTMNKLK